MPTECQRSNTGKNWNGSHNKLPYPPEQRTVQTKKVPLVLFKAEQTPARPIHFSESECKPFNGLSNDSANNQDKKKSNY